jgi:23S rRNA (pseudouridine1915-N3)-methyltransferase
MLQLHLLCVGKLKESFYLDACGEYQKRMNAHCKLTITELPEERITDHPSPSQIEAALRKEADLIVHKLPKGAELIALCVEGKMLSSEILSKKLNQWMLNGSSSLVFVIGGSYGLHPSLKQQATLCLSMSPMTFPHHLARVMVLEQLYRSFQISSGTRYHK